eukprot:2800688-Pleurochrysis_carterae.AAC.11
MCQKLKCLSIHCSGEVLSGMELKYEASCRAGVETPPLVADNASAVEFTKTVLDSRVGTPIEHSFSIADAVAVQISQLLLNAKNAATRRALAPHFGLGAVYIVLASLYFKSRMPAPSKESLRRLLNVLTRKAAEKRAAGLIESFRIANNQRRYIPEFASLTAVQAEQQLLLRWDVVHFGASIFEGSISSSSLRIAAGASATVAGSASAGLDSCGASHHHNSDETIVSNSNTITNTPTSAESTGKPHEAGTCTAANAEVAGAGGSSVTGAFAKPAAGAAIPRADGKRGQPPARINICAGGYTVADADDDDEDDNDDDDDDDDAPPPAGRHAATYELECIRLRHDQ